MKQELNNNTVPFANLLVVLAKGKKDIPIPSKVHFAKRLGFKGLVARAWKINPLFADRLAKGTVAYTQTFICVNGYYEN